MRIASRTPAHYRGLFADASTVGTNLLARAVYAARYGDADHPRVEELTKITRELLRRHGEYVSSVDALEELDTALATRPSLIAQIRARRKALGLSQREAAQRVGLHQPNWSFYERRQQDPTVAIFEKMACAVGLEVRLVELE